MSSRNIDFLRSQERSELGIYLIEHDGTYEVVLHPVHISRLQGQVNTEYNPTKVEGFYWLRHAAAVIRSFKQPEVAQTYRQKAESSGLYEELERAIVIHDIAVRLHLSAVP